MAPISLHMNNFSDDPIYGYYSTIGMLMRAAREYKGLSQLSVATAIRCSQSALSKYESGLMVLSAPQWFEFCQLLEIPVSSLSQGFIDRNTRISKPVFSNKIRFRERYHALAGTKSRELAPICAILRDNKNANYLDWLEKSISLPRYIVHDYDFQISGLIVLDVLQFMMLNGLFHSSQLPFIVPEVYGREYYGQQFDYLMGSSSPEVLIGRWIETQDYFQVDYEVKLEAIGMDLATVTIEPRPHFIPSFTQAKKEAQEAYWALKHCSLQSLLQKKFKGFTPKVEFHLSKAIVKPFHLEPNVRRLAHNH